MNVRTDPSIYNTIYVCVYYIPQSVYIENTACKSMNKMFTERTLCM